MTAARALYAILRALDHLPRTTGDGTDVSRPISRDSEHATPKAEESAVETRGPSELVVCPFCHGTVGLPHYTCRPPREGFWTDPEWKNRDKDCTYPGCQGTGFLRNVLGPNELPCPRCRPLAATGL